MEDTEDCPLSETEFVAERCDIWRTAYATMRSVGIETPEPDDVLQLAEFIAGDNLRPNADVD